MHLIRDLGRLLFCPKIFQLVIRPCLLIQSMDDNRPWFHMDDNNICYMKKIIIKYFTRFHKTDNNIIKYVS